MKFNFNVSDSLRVGIERLSSVLGYELGDGIEVSAVKGDRLGVSFEKGKAIVYYKSG